MSIAESAKVIQRKSSVRSSGTIDYFKSDPKCMIEFREGRELKMTYRKGFFSLSNVTKIQTCWLFTENVPILQLVQNTIV